MENLFSERPTEEVLLEVGHMLPPPPERKKLKKIYSSPQPGDAPTRDKDYRWPGLKVPQGGSLTLSRSQRKSR